jgi:hypothetical protein
VPEQAAEEPEEHPIRKRLPEHHEGEAAPVGDRGQDVAPEPLGALENPTLQLFDQQQRRRP